VSDTTKATEDEEIVTHEDFWSLMRVLHDSRMIVEYKRRQVRDESGLEGGAAQKIRAAVRRTRDAVGIGWDIHFLIFGVERKECELCAKHFGQAWRDSGVFDRRSEASANA